MEEELIMQSSLLRLKIIGMSLSAIVSPLEWSVIFFSSALLTRELRLTPLQALHDTLCLSVLPKQNSRHDRREWFG